MSAYNRSLIEASLDPLVTIGADGRIIDVNSATEAVTGRPRAELIGTDFSRCFTEPEQAQAQLQQAWRAGFVRDQALELRHRDGHSTSVLYNASVYRDDQWRRRSGGRGRPPHPHVRRTAGARAVGPRCGQIPGPLRLVRQLRVGRRRIAGAGRLDVWHSCAEERHPRSGGHQT